MIQQMHEELHQAISSQRHVGHEWQLRLLEHSQVQDNSCCATEEEETSDSSV